MKRTIKTAFAVTAAGLFALTSLGTALAEGTPTPTPATVTPSPTATAIAELHIAGAVSAIAAAATPPTVTIHPKEGADVTVKIVSTTVITKAGTGKAALADIAVGDRANASYSKDTLEASKLTLTLPLTKHRTYEGTIKSLAANSFVMTTKKHGDATILVNADTKYKVPGVKDATLASLHTGGRVAVLAVETKDGNVALHVNAIPAKPAHVQRVGIVDSYVAGKSITLKDKKGDASTFAIDANTKIMLKRGATAVTAGERVTVIARRDPSTDQFTARQILVLGQKGGPGDKGAPADKGNPNK